MKTRILVGEGSCGLAAGAAAVYSALEEKLAGVDATLSITGCIGLCFLEPIVDVYDENGKLYNSPAMHRLNIQLETVGWDSNRVPLFHLVFPSASSSYWTINESTSFMSMIVNADGPAECDKRSTRSVRPFMIF